MEYRVINDVPLEPDCSGIKSIYRYKVVTTLIFFFTWINLGLTNCVLSSTLPDFRHRIGINNEEFGRMMVVVIAFSTTAGLVGGVLADRFQHKTILFLAIAQLINALSHGLVPWSINVYMGAVMFILRNLTHQCCNAFGSAYVVAMWAEKASVWIHFLHMGYPVGCIFGPVITGPFLSRLKEETDYDACVTLNCTNSEKQGTYNSTSLMDSAELNLPTPAFPFANATPVSKDFEKSRIEIPYGIGGVSMFLSAILFFLLHFNVIKRPSDFALNRKPAQALRDACNPRTCAPGRPCFGVSMITSFFLFYVFLVAIEATITNTFLFTYAVEGPFKFTNQEADQLDIAFKGCYLLGRLLILPIAHALPIQMLLFVEITLSLGSTVGLATLGTRQRRYLWLFSCLFNVTIAPVWPGGYAWFDRYVSLYTVIISFGDIFTQTSMGVTSWLVGYILDYRNPDDIWILTSVICAALLLVLSTSQVIACCHGERRFSVEKPMADENAEQALLQNVGTTSDISEEEEL